MTRAFAWAPPIIVQELFHQRPHDLQRLPRCELGVTDTPNFRRHNVVRARDTTMAGAVPGTEAALRLP